MSSKGQVVIPVELREDLKEGDKFMIIRKENQIVLKKITDQDLEDDLRFAMRTEAAYQEYKKGHSKSMTAKEFLRELKKW